MPTQIRIDVRQSALSVRGPENPRASQRGRVLRRVVRHVEIVLGSGLESLFSVERHVLDHEEGAVGLQDVV